jgi:hypothetical protein
MQQRTEHQQMLSTREATTTWVHLGWHADDGAQIFRRAQAT